MWNQQIAPDVYANDRHGRFVYGTPPTESADWGWAQHLVATLKPSGRMALVIDREAISRGSNDGVAAASLTDRPERAIRRALVEADLIEAVLCCSPSNRGRRLGSSVVKWALSHAVLLVFDKKKQRPGEMLFIDGSSLFGQVPYAEMIDQVVSLYREWRPEPGVSFVAKVRHTAENDFDLNPARYLKSTGGSISSSRLPSGSRT
jgi:type I restriction enzyme M protein